MSIVTLLEPIHPAGIALLSRGAQLRQLRGPADPGLAAALADTDALIVRSTRIDAALLDQAPRLRVLGRHGAGTDNIDRAHAERRGIRVVKTPRSNTESVGEYTITVLLQLFKRIDAAADALRRGEFRADAGSLPGQVDRLGLVGREVHGATLGLIGAGAIGQSVARRARALGMRVVAADPYQDRERLAELGITLVASIDELLPLADAVSLHVPGDPGGAPLLGARELAMLPPGAVLINAARGGLVDEHALAAALTAGTLAGAAVDVFTTEPPDPGAALFRAPNLILTPHMAAMTGEALERMAVDVARFTLDALADTQPRQDTAK